MPPPRSSAQALASKALVCVAVAAACTGCSATAENASREELASLGRGQGIVVGSFAIAVDYSADSEPGKRVWIRADARRTIYQLNITRRGPRGERLARYGQKVRVTPWEPAAFVKKLPAGEYEALSLDVYDGTLRSLDHRLLHANVDFHFRVEPGVVNYVGRMVVTVPQRLISGDSQVGHLVEDAEEDDLAALGWLLAEARYPLAKRLAGLQAVRFPYGKCRHPGTSGCVSAF